MFAVLLINTKKIKKMESTKIEFKRVNNDVNGNPRYVCHFRDLNTKKDEEIAEQ